MKKCFIVFFIIFLTGCSNVTNNKKGEFNFDSEYKKALYEIRKNHFYTASEIFEKINLDGTKLDDKSIILSAFSYYKSKQYIESLNVIDFFEKTFPMHDEMIYMNYLKILSYFKRLEYVGKGVDLAQIGYDLCINFLVKYENSIYYDDVLSKLEIFKNYIVANELEVIRFNLSRNNFIPALKRLDYIKKNFYNNLYMDEIYFRYIEIYKYIGYDYDSNLINKIKSEKWKDLAEKL